MASFPFYGGCGFGFRVAASGLLAYLCGFSRRPFAGLALGRSGGGRSCSGLRPSGAVASRSAPLPCSVRLFLFCPLCRCRSFLVLLARSLSRRPRVASLSRPVSAGRTRVRPCSRPLSFVALCASPLAFFFRGCLSRSPPAFARGLACRLFSSSLLFPGAGLPVAASPARLVAPPAPCRSLRSLPPLARARSQVRFGLATLRASRPVGVQPVAVSAVRAFWLAGYSPMLNLCPPFLIFFQRLVYFRAVAAGFWSLLWEFFPLERSGATQRPRPAPLVAGHPRTRDLYLREVYIISSPSRSGISPSS